MGACGSSEAGGAGLQPTMEEVSRSKALDKQIRGDSQRMAKEIKMLLLGPGSSGKSTILKQMKVIHLDGFTAGEKEAYRQQIWLNLRDGMQACFALMDELGIGFTDGTLFEKRMLVAGLGEVRERQAFPAELLAPLKALWKDTGLQAAVLKGSEATVPEYTYYFYDEIDRLFSPSYSPTNQDILRCRQKTTDISETTFESRDLQYRIFDVGGQRSERKKWIHCFEDVTSILFLAAISGYDQVLIEDRDSNQMQEALMLFDSICNSQWFTKTSIVLFLNKVDIFKERILLSPIKHHFPDYKGDDTDYNMAKELFKRRFVSLNRSNSKEIYVHFTTAIDTSLVKVVMTSVYDAILSRNLNEFML
ncbi:hypothetical protein JCM8547_007048 [Rhodosporidiobolus lusitaniae]